MNIWPFCSAQHSYTSVMTKTWVTKNYWSLWIFCIIKYICVYLEFWQARKNGVEVSIIPKNFHYSTNIKEVSLEIFTHLKELGFAQQCLSSLSQIFILPYMLSFKTRHLEVLWTVPFMSIYSCCYRSLTTVQSCFDFPTKAASGLHHCALYFVFQRSAVDLRATRSPA